jgi:hypothetical protein
VVLRLRLSRAYRSEIRERAAKAIGGSAMDGRRSLVIQDLRELKQLEL